MRRIHADAADLLAVHVKNVDLTLALENLNFEFQAQDEGRRLWPALVTRIGKARSRQFHLAALLHDVRGFRLQNWILVVADTKADVCPGNTCDVPNRTWTRCRRLEREGEVPAPLSGEIRHGRDFRRGCRRSKHPTETENEEHARHQHEALRSKN